jgi:hypothetical protein
MTDLIKHINNKDYESANKALEDNFKVILEGKLHEMKKMCAAKMTEQNDHDERMKRLRSDVIEEDGVDEGLLKVARNTLKLLSPSARANMKKPVLRNISGKPMQKLKIEPKKLEEEDASEESSMARSELQAITKDAKSIMSKIKGNKELESWTQSKITKAADYMNAVADYMEGEKEKTLDEVTRIGIVKLRIRGGKVQRRQKVSNVPGMTLRGGQLRRMSAAERRRRKLGAKRGARKTQMKRTQLLRKRKMSLMKRQRLGG